MVGNKQILLLPTLSATNLLNAVQMANFKEKERILKLEAECNQGLDLCNTAFCVPCLCNKTYFGGPKRTLVEVREYFCSKATVDSTLLVFKVCFTIQSTIVSRKLNFIACGSN